MQEKKLQESADSPGENRPPPAKKRPGRPRNRPIEGVSPDAAAAFKRRTDALSASAKISLGEIGHRLGIARTTLHYMRTGRLAATQQVLATLEHMEQHGGRPPRWAPGPEGDVLEIFIRIPPQGITADSTGSVTIPLSYKEPAPGRPTEVVLEPRLDTMEAFRLFFDAVLNQKTEQIILRVLPIELATKAFLDSVTTTTLMKLLEGSLLVLFGREWHTEVKKLLEQSKPARTE